MIRGLVKSVVEGVIKRFSASGRTDETIDNREYFQHYGFTSRPKEGAELIIIDQGNVMIAVASDDRRYRLALGAGEVALYDDQGQKLHLMANGNIEVLALTKCKVTAPTVEIIASTKVTMTTPLLEVSGNITAGGSITAGTSVTAGTTVAAGTAVTAGTNITATGNVADAGGAKTMAGMRGGYNTHSHSNHGVAPNNQL